MMPKWPVHARVDGPIVMIGFGSIGKGTLPLIERHFSYDKKRFIVIDPEDKDRKLLDSRGIRFIHQAVTKDNYRHLLTPLLTAGGGQGFCVNVSVDTSSLDIMELCREIGALYIDTVVEPWKGFYFDPKLGPEARSNYALRETILAARRKRPGGPTAVSCCGANPGMVSWFVKQALLNIAGDTGLKFKEPKTREDWARLARKAGIKGIHIAERDTQRAKQPKPMNVFVNTWSVEGFVSEGLQPAELGWGTHEKWLPANARRHKTGCGAAIYLLQPGANTRVRSWTPTAQAQYGFLVTHNESISIADYFTLRQGRKTIYRPTCHYAYHPCNDAVLSLHEVFGRAGAPQEDVHILDEHEIADGIDELGVLLYGHKKNAYWYGSQLSIDETREVAPYQNATGLQVTSAVLAGMVWALENPKAGIVETDEMDFRRCLEVQMPYLGPVIGTYTDWTPLTGRPGLFPEDIDKRDPWQFRNVLNALTARRRTHLVQRAANEAARFVLCRPSSAISAAREASRRASVAVSSAAAARPSLWWRTRRTRTRRRPWWARRWWRLHLPLWWRWWWLHLPLLLCAAQWRGCTAAAAAAALAVAALAAAAPAAAVQAVAVAAPAAVAVAVEEQVAAAPEAESAARYSAVAEADHPQVRPDRPGHDVPRGARLARSSLAPLWPAACPTVVEMPVARLPQACCC